LPLSKTTSFVWRSLTISEMLSEESPCKVKVIMFFYNSHLSRKLLSFSPLIPLLRNFCLDYIPFLFVFMTVCLFCLFFCLFLTHFFSKLLKSNHADQPVGAAGISESLHPHGAGLASSLLQTVLKSYNILKRCLTSLTRLSCLTCLNHLSCLSCVIKNKTKYNALLGKLLIM